MEKRKNTRGVVIAVVILIAILVAIIAWRTWNVEVNEQNPAAVPSELEQGIEE